MCEYFLLQKLHNLFVQTGHIVSQHQIVISSYIPPKKMKQYEKLLKKVTYTIQIHIKEITE